MLEDLVVRMEAVPPCSWNLRRPSILSWSFNGAIPSQGIFQAQDRVFDLARRISVACRTLPPCPPKDFDNDEDDAEAPRTILPTPSSRRHARPTAEDVVTLENDPAVSPSIF